MRQTLKLGSVIVAALGLGLISLGAYAKGSAASLSTGFAKVRVNDLQPGKTYLVSQLYAPIRVSNNSETTLDLRMQLIRPRPADVEPGFEPVPDLSWFRLEKTTFTVAPWQSAETDMIVTVGKGRAHQGKKYQLHIWTLTVPKGSGVSVGLMHKFLFTIAEKPDDRRRP